MMISASLTREIEPLPLWEKESAHEAQRIIVVSDLHLGVDDSFSETVKNKDLLTEFLERLVISDIDELVIAGDMLDEWFVPISYEPHNDLGAFFEKVAENNASIVAAFEKIIQSGVVVAYVPGNHDLLLDEETLAKLIPGIVQARDVDGLGTYRTGMRSEIVIEHGHRYDTFCAPDILSNKEMTGDYPSFLPPGYFFTRIASTSVQLTIHSLTNRLSSSTLILIRPLMWSSSGTRTCRSSIATKMSMTKKKYMPTAVHGLTKI